MTCLVLVSVMLYSNSGGIAVLVTSIYAIPWNGFSFVTFLCNDYISLIKTRSYEPPCSFPALKHFFLVVFERFAPEPSDPVC